MLLNAYTLYDVKALLYSPPFFMATHGLAVRAVSELANDLGTSVGKHPQDYTLYCVGRFDDASGAVLSIDVREHVSDILPLVKLSQQAELFRSPVTNGKEAE